MLGRTFDAGWALVVWLACGCASAPSLPDQQLSILRPVVDHVAERGRRLRLGSYSVVDPFDRCVGRRQEMAEKLPGLRADTLASFCGVAGRRLRLTRSQKRELIPPQDRSSAFTPASGEYVISFSSIGLSEDADQAFVLLNVTGDYEDFGDYYLLEKSRGEWRIVGVLPGWIA
jgi:hypothetical protein